VGTAYGGTMSNTYEWSTRRRDYAAEVNKSSPQVEEVAAHPLLSTAVRPALVACFVSGSSVGRLLAQACRSGGLLCANTAHDAGFRSLALPVAVSLVSPIIE